MDYRPNSPLKFLLIIVGLVAVEIGIIYFFMHRMGLA